MVTILLWIVSLLLCCGGILICTYTFASQTSRAVRENGFMPPFTLKEYVMLMRISRTCIFIGCLFLVVQSVALLTIMLHILAVLVCWIACMTMQNYFRIKGFNLNSQLFSKFGYTSRKD